MDNGLLITSGCFDLFHAGHVSFLQAASEISERLVVLLNTDESMRRIKGFYPIYSYVQRRAILEACKYVRSVKELDVNTPIDLLLEMQPKFFVKGTEWAGKRDDEVETLRLAGIQTVYLPHKFDYIHTSSILKSIKGDS